MTIRELITQLETIQRTHGDLPVYTYVQDLDWMAQEITTYVVEMNGWEADPPSRHQRLCVRIGVDDR